MKEELPGIMARDPHGKQCSRRHTGSDWPGQKPGTVEDAILAPEKIALPLDRFHSFRNCFLSTKDHNLQISSGP